MESDSSSIDLTRLNEELPVKIEEMLKLSNKEDDIISLRLLDLTDVDDFMEWFTDDNVNKFCSRDTTFITKEDAMRYIADVVIPHPWFRAICLNDKPIGSISVSSFHGNDRCRGEIGYEISSKYWGKGIATKAVKMVASTIFVDWPHLARLEGVVAVDNVGSQRVLEKAGFIKEGVLRKYYLVKGKPIDIVMFFERFHSIVACDSKSRSVLSWICWTIWEVGQSGSNRGFLAEKILDKTSNVRI